MKVKVVLKGQHLGEVHVEHTALRAGAAAICGMVIQASHISLSRQASLKLECGEYAEDVPICNRQCTDKARLALQNLSQKVRGVSTRMKDRPAVSAVVA